MASSLMLFIGPLDFPDDIAVQEGLLPWRPRTRAHTSSVPDVPSRNEASSNISYDVVLLASNTISQIITTSYILYQGPGICTQP